MLAARHYNADVFGEEGRVAAKRDKNLQIAANSLAAQWRQENNRTFSEREISCELAKSEEWNHMTAGRIERIIRVEW